MTLGHAYMALRDLRGCLAWPKVWESGRKKTARQVKAGKTLAACKHKRSLRGIMYICPPLYKSLPK
jgi:hypothetical protein